MWFASLRTLGMSYRIFLEWAKFSTVWSQISPLLSQYGPRVYDHLQNGLHVCEADGAARLIPGNQGRAAGSGRLELPAGVFSVSEPAAADKARSLMKLFLFKARSLLSQGWKPQRLRESPSDLWGLCPDSASRTSISEVSEGSHL